MSDMPALRATDPEIHRLIALETKREADYIRLIPSENYASAAVMEATGSVLANKYSEGYPGKRYYEGQEYIDQVETLAIERAKSLFGMQHANVQPYSGSPANQAVYLALAKPGEHVMGLGLPFGGHLTHGWGVNFSGIVYRADQYDVDPETHRVDLNRVETLARETKPKLIFCGGTAYPRTWDYAGFAQIAKAVGAVLVADIAHIAGLIVAGAHPHPYPHATIVTTTTHKTLRGPRGGMILCDASHAKDIDRAVFPGLQGGPHNHTTAAIAVALKEASTAEFRDYGQQIVKNAKALHAAGIECNYNTSPFDPRKPFDPSGLR
ncbi:MAG TPA: serine hydroxymethyltransferase, partial [Gammaproteobacteria bacterium]|nr:serine hydroxymethyltransferase [Gammaproteobacteria bacterium]